MTASRLSDGVYPLLKGGTTTSEPWRSGATSRAFPESWSAVASAAVRVFCFGLIERIGLAGIGQGEQHRRRGPHRGTGGRGLGPDGVGQAEGVGTTLACGAGRRRSARTFAQSGSDQFGF